MGERGGGDPQIVRGCATGRASQLAVGAIIEDDDLAGVKVVVLTTFEIDAYVIEAARAGAGGFLSKSIEPADRLAELTTREREMTKLAVRDRAQLVVLAYQSGLVRPGDRLD